MDTVSCIVTLTVFEHYCIAHGKVCYGIFSNVSWNIRNPALTPTPRANTGLIVHDVHMHMYMMCTC